MKVELRALPPREAIGFFRSKGLAPPDRRFDFRDVWRNEHARQFVVAKAMRDEVLQTIRGALDQALAGGQTMAAFTAALEPELRRLGWWGEGTERDPVTGGLRTVRLGSRRRLEVIFDANMRAAHAAGKWARIQRVKDEFPFLWYRQIQRETRREEHRRYHDLIRPVDDPIWLRIYPPNGWRCGCTVRQVSREKLDELGLRVTEGFALEERAVLNRRTGAIEPTALGVDPAWDGNPGAVWAGMRRAPAPTGTTPAPGGFGRIDDPDGFARAEEPPGVSLPDVRRSIDPAIRDAAVFYQGSGYRDLNRALRGQGAMTGELARIRDALDRAISETPLPRALMLYRGIGDVPQLRVGELLSDDAYSSFTLRPRTAVKFATVGDGPETPPAPAGPQANVNVVLRLRAEAGSRGIYLGEWEEEIILRRGLGLRIVAGQVIEFDHPLLPGERHRIVVYDVEIVADEA